MKKTEKQIKARAEFLKTPQGRLYNPWKDLLESGAIYKSKKAAQEAFKRSQVKPEPPK